MFWTLSINNALVSREVPDPLSVLRLSASQQHPTSGWFPWGFQQKNACLVGAIGSIRDPVSSIPWGSPSRGRDGTVSFVSLVEVPFDPQSFDLDGKTTTGRLARFMIE